MTAANLLVIRDQVVLVSDRAALRGDGRLMRCDRKIVARDGLRFAFVVAGPMSLAMHDDCRAWLNHQRNEDHALAALPNLLATLAGAVRNGDWRYDPHRVLGEKLAMTVGLWSPNRRKAEGYVLASHEGIFPPHVPILVPHAAAQYISPTVDTGGIDAGDPVETICRTLLERQRQSVVDYGYSNVGGGGDMAIVDGSGLTIAHIASWPDRMGERIDTSLAITIPR